MKGSFREVASQKAEARLTFDHFESEILLTAQVSGGARPQATGLDPPACQPPSFLLRPGGRDYVGDNSYDAQAEAAQGETS